MKLPENVACQEFKIFQPRWHDRKVLLAAHKVGTHNLVEFTQAPTLEGKYYISGHDIHMCKLGNNGTIACYEVPLHYLEPLERTPRSAKQLKLLE